MVTLEMIIILLKELVMYTEDNKRYSYLNDRHLALIEVRILLILIAIHAFVDRTILKSSSVWFLKSPEDISYPRAI